MRAARHRLKFFTGASLTAATYGGGLYGDDTYGMQASDALTTAHHRIVPWPGGALTSPSWVYRQNDTEPDFQAQLIADDGLVDYTGVEFVLLILTHQDFPGRSMFTYPLVITTMPNGDQRLTKNWETGDLGVPGVYRVGISVGYSSRRLLSVPADDRHTFVVTPDGTPPTPPPFDWSTARWGFATWDRADWSIVP